MRFLIGVVSMGIVIQAFVMPPEFLVAVMRVIG